MSLRGTGEFVRDSIMANRLAFNAHKELYHFLMAANQYGLKAIVDETTTLLMERGYDYLSAINMSVSRANYLFELAKGEQRIYQEVRGRLDSSGGFPSDAPSPDWPI